MAEKDVGKDRIEWIDVLRGFGIVLMIMGHIDFGYRFCVYIHAFHMPLFIVVAGFFFNPRRNYREYLVHDLRTLILPYTVFFLFCQLLCLLHTGRLDFHYAAESYFNSASRPIRAC